MDDDSLIYSDDHHTFTGHEKLEEVGLIHMNGRVFDATLGRFLSADPYITHPYNSQGYNRYTYVYNNPLSFTDPTGLTPDNPGVCCSDISEPIPEEPESDKKKDDEESTAFDNPTDKDIEEKQNGKSFSFGSIFSWIGNRLGYGEDNDNAERVNSTQRRDAINTVADILGKIWNLPNTVLGLTIGGIGHVAGLIMGTNPSISFDNNAIQFHNNPFMRSAMTLGNVAIYGPKTSPDSPNVHFQNTPRDHTVG